MIKQFTKDKLVSGEHIVETDKGVRYLVAGEYLISRTGYIRLSQLDVNLVGRSHVIDKVFSGKNDKYIFAGRGFDAYSGSEQLVLIWDRNKVNKDIDDKLARLKELEDSQRALADELNALRKELEEE